MNIRVITFMTLLLVWLSACADFDPQVYVPGLETNTPAGTQESAVPLAVARTEPAATHISTEALTMKVCTHMVGGKLHVRFEPGDNSEVRGYLAEGEMVTVGAQRAERDGSLWLQLSDPIKGWVNAKYLCPAN